MGTTPNEYVLRAFHVFVAHIIKRAEGWVLLAHDRILFFYHTGFMALD
jgi:hypothetical protein